MREVYIFSTSAFSNQGGISSAAASFISCLRESGVSIKEFTTHEPTAGRLKNCLIFTKSLIRFFMTIILIRASFKELPHVYIHVGPKGSLIRKFIVAMIARLFGVKVYTHHHSPTFEHYLKRSNIWNKLLIGLAKMSTKNLVLSQWWYDLYSGSKVKNICIVPNCLPRSAPPLSSEIDSKTKSILSIGRLVSGKNFDLVINSVLLDPGEIRLKIAGNGPEFEKLEAITRSRLAAEKIQFLGWIGETEKNRLYDTSDLFVLPSNYDSFGMVYIESLSRGCPVVIGPNAAVVSALEGLEGVFIASDFSVESVHEAMLRGLAYSRNKKNISESCIGKYGPQTISKLLVEALELDYEKG